MKHASPWALCFLLVFSVSCGKEEADPGPSDCPAGQERCDEGCVDTGSDPAHCGGCGLACRTDEVCEAGSCAPSPEEACPEGEARCGDACIDLNSDLGNCGACGKACAAGTVCREGECETLCPEGWSECDGSCVDTKSDPQHCGACGSTCRADQSCVAGICRCDEGQTECGGSCVDTSSDLAHCGACDQACGVPPDALASACTERACVPVCEEGRHDCDGDFANGCETETRSDPANCGACDFDCAALPNLESVTGCDEGTCVFSCKENYDDCDGDPANGCEADLLRDAEHCSACNESCSALPKVAVAKCEDGACGIVECQPGFGDCDGDPSNGCEVDLLNEKDFCGSCDNACELGCFEGACAGIANAAAGPSQTLALTEDGRIYGWGENSAGQIGDGTTAWATLPVSGPSLSRVVQLGAGTRFGCALQGDGTVWCWGNASSGKLGHGNSTESSLTPVQAMDTAGAFKDAISISTRNQHTCAVTSQGALWCWGANSKGQLGTGDQAVRSRPNLVPGLKDVVEVGAGSSFTCARTGTQGEHQKAVFCWGSNASGQVGDGTQTDTHKPGDPVFVGAEKLAVGSSHACVVDSEGKVHCWGSNEYLQSGAPEGEVVLAPTEVPDAPKSKAIFGGGHFTCALSEEEELWCWGRNEFGQLGIGDEDGSNHGPTKVETLSAVTTATTGFDHACAITADKALWCWGRNKDRKVAPIVTESINAPRLVEWGE